MKRTEWIIRAWKDPEYRASLSAEERAALPESPAGQSLAELEEAQLRLAVGGYECEKEPKIIILAIKNTRRIPCVGA